MLTKESSSHFHLKMEDSASLIFAEQSSVEYENSRLITAQLVKSIKQQERLYKKDVNISQTKTSIRNKKRNDAQTAVTLLKGILSVKQVRLMGLNQEPNASSWLTALPFAEEGYYLEKQCFRDLLRIRYGWNLSRLPSSCECGASFSIEHALSCKKGGFISMRHNQIRNFTAKALRDVCHDVCVEPMLQKLTGEEELPKSANITDEGRLDTSARGFWVTGQKAFFDVRVFNPLAKRYGTLNSQKCYELNEREKKKEYNNRIMEIENGTFTPLVFSATGGAGRECRKFCKRLAEMISEKKKSRYSETVTWVNRKINFAIMKALHICVRGSRSSMNQSYESVFNPDICEKITQL